MIIRFSIGSNSWHQGSFLVSLINLNGNAWSSLQVWSIESTFKSNDNLSLARKFDKNKNNWRNHVVLYLKWPLLWAWTALVNCCELALGSFDCSSKRPNIPFPLASIKSMQSWLSEKEIFFTPRPSFSYKSCSSLRILWLKNCCNFSLQ